MSNLIEFDSGVADGATLTTLGVGGDSNITNGWTAGNIGWLDAQAGQDGVYTGATATFTLGNLTPGTYRVMLVAAEATPGFPSTADFTVNSAFANTDRLGTSANGDDWNTSSNGVNNWMEWSSVASTGTLTLSIDTLGGFTTVNALRVESLSTIPEPSSSVLLILSAVALASSRSRRN